MAAYMRASACPSTSRAAQRNPFQAQRPAPQRVRRSLARASLLSEASSELPIADKLRRTVELFYTEVLQNGTPELIPSLCSRGVTFSDARGHCDFLGAAGLTQYVEDIAAAHPLLRVEVDSVDLDPSCGGAVAEWHATAAHLLPGRDGAPATGLVSEICGLDQITFAADGRISSIVSFRERFAEEEDAWTAAAE